MTCSNIGTEYRGFSSTPSCALIPCCGVEAASMGKRKVNANYRRTVLRLPDRDHSKVAVLNSLTSPSSRRVYQFAIDQFVAWYRSEPRLAFNRIVVVRYRMYLESEGWLPTPLTSNWPQSADWRTRLPMPGCSVPIWRRGAIPDVGQRLYRSTFRRARSALSVEISGTIFLHGGCGYAWTR